MSDPIQCAGCSIGKAAGLRFGGRCPMVFRRHAAGETMSLEGERGHTVWFVKRGAVLLSRSGPDGVERPHAVRAPGAFVGLEAVVTGSYADSARTTEPSVLCGATNDTIDRWLGPVGTPARTALEQVLLATSHDTPRAASSDGSAIRRVARWLLDARDQPEVPRHVLASLLGMVPETLSRALARLRDGGAVALTRRTVTITDADKLEALSA